MKNPLTDENKEAITEMVTEISTFFSKEYIMAITTGCVAAAIADSMEEGEESPYQLLTAPPPSDILKEGVMKKRGAVRTGLKNRYFVAKNVADNFVMEYYENEAQKKLKGSITLAGYWPYKLDDEEKQKYKLNYGFKLHPYNDKRREWILGCETEDDEKDWINTLKKGCWNADPPKNEDEVMAEAFATAYTETRWEHGYYNWVPVDCSESEQFGFMVSAMLYDKLTHQFLEEVPNTFKNKARTAIDKFVIATAQAQWVPIATAATVAKDTIQGQLAKGVAPIADARKDLKGKVVDSISDTLNPAIAAAGEKFGSKLIGFIASPLTNASIQLIEDMSNLLKDDVDKAKAGENINGLMESRIRSALYYYSGPMKRANSTLYDLYDLMRSQHAMFPENFECYKLYNVLLSGFEKICRDTPYTLLKFMEGKSSDQLPLALKDTLGKLANDLKVLSKSLLCESLNMILEEVVNENAKKPALELVAPLDDLVPEAMADILSPGGLVGEIIDDVLGGAIETLIDASYTPEATKLTTSSETALKQAIGA